MEQLIQKLETLHVALIEVLDEGDTERLECLIQQRGDAIAALSSAHQAAPAADQAAVASTLERLAYLDQDLQARCQAERNQLGQRLSQARQNSSHMPVPAASGVLDRRA